MGSLLLIFVLIVKSLALISVEVGGSSSSQHLVLIILSLLSCVAFLSVCGYLLDALSVSRDFSSNFGTLFICFCLYVLSREDFFLTDVVSLISSNADSYGLPWKSMVNLSSRIFFISSLIVIVMSVLVIAIEIPFIFINNSRYFGGIFAISTFRPLFFLVLMSLSLPLVLSLILHLLK